MQQYGRTDGTLTNNLCVFSCFRDRGLSEAMYWLKCDHHKSSDSYYYDYIRKVLSAAQLSGLIVVCFLQSAGRFWSAEVMKFFGSPCTYVT